MAANMQAMGGAGQMMQQQQGPFPAALTQHVLQSLRVSQSQLLNPTWQTAVPLQDRMTRTMQLITNCRLANPGSDMMSSVNFGSNFEREMFTKLPTREQYDQAMSSKTTDFWRRRQANEPALQQQLNQNAQAQAMMNMNMHQMGRGMNQQAFQQMQQGMQPMNLQQQQQQQFQQQQQRLQQQAQQQRQQQQAQQPMRQQHPQQQQQMPQQQLGMGMDMGMNMNMGMNMGVANQAGRGMAPNQQMANVGNAQNRPGQGGDNISRLAPGDRAKVTELANKMMLQASDEQKQVAMNTVRAKLTPQQLQEMQANNKDPMLMYYQQQALNLLRSKSMRQAQGPNQAQGQPQNQNQNQNQAQAAAMQQQHSQQAMQQRQNMMNNAAQGGNDFSQFPSSMESIKDQQMNGVKAQQAGQVVVPASNGSNRNIGSQPMAQTMSNQQGSNQGVRQPHQQPTQQQNANMQQMKMNQPNQHPQAQLQGPQAQQNQMTQMQNQHSNMGSNMGPSQSPGMGTLNTPVSRPPSGMNQMGMQGMGQGNVQFGDARFNQGVQRPNQQAYAAMLAEMTPQQRQQLQEMPPEKLQEMTRRWQQMGQMAARQNQMNMAGGAQQNLNQPPNRPPSQVGQMNGNMPAQGQQGMQQSPQSGNIPGQAAQAQAMMEMLDVPPQIIAHLSQFVQLGPEIKKWRDLRMWVSQNSNSLPAQIRNELGTWQRKQFQQVLARRQAAGAPNPNFPMNQPAQNGGAQMPMVPNGMQQRQQIGQGMPAHIMQVSPADLTQVRNQKPQFANVPDEQLRTIVLAMKRQAWQQHQNMRLAQQTHNQAANQGQNQNQAQPNQIGPNTTPAPQPNMNMQQPMQTGSNAQANRVVNVASQAIPAPNGQPKATGVGVGAEPATNNRGKKSQGQPTPSPAQVGKNLKRPSNDDAEAPAPQQQQQHKTGPASGAKSFPQLTAEDVASMRPDQRAKYEQFRRAQLANAQASAQPAQTGQAQQVSQTSQAPQAAQASQPFQNTQAPQGAAGAENLARLRAIGQEEQRSFSQQPMPDVQMTPQELTETAQKLQRMVGDMSKIGRGLSKWYSLTQDDHRARLFFRTRLRILKQFVDGEQMQVLRDSFSIRSGELDQARAMLESMAKDLARSVFPRGMMKGPSQPAQGTPAQGQPGAQAGSQQVNASSQQQPQQSQQTVPLNAANLEKNSQALKAQRKSGQGFKVPTAPTTTQPPFSFAAPSPHGNPNYANAQEPPMELKIPPRKKSKVGSGSQAATPSPQVSKASPPRPQSQSRDVQQPRPAEPQKPVLLCKDPECALSLTGYYNEEQLKKHIEEVHTKPKEDALKFAQDSLASALGLEPDGTAKKDTKPTAAPPMSASMSKQSLALAVNTPHSQDSAVSMKRSASSQKDMMKSANKGDANQYDANVAADPWANATLDPQLLMSSLGLDNGVHSVIFDVNAFRALTPPEDTPESSKDSGASEPTSDISEGAALDIDVHWQQMDGFETELLLNLDRTSLQGAPASFGISDAPTMDPALLFNNVQLDVPDWDEINPDFSKPFELDTSLYSMDTS